MSGQPFSRVLREGGSPAPGDLARYERALDALEPFVECGHKCGCTSDVECPHYECGCADDGN